MVEIVLVVRKPGSEEVDYSLKFNVPQVPCAGDYILIQRPDKQAPYGEDMIVRHVWWRLSHQETGGHAQRELVGKADEVFVECDPAIGPYSSDQWRRSLENRDPPIFNVRRVTLGPRG